MPIDALVLLAIVITVVALALRAGARGRQERPADPTIDAAWAKAAQAEGPVGQMLLRVARPMSDIPSIYGAATSPQYRFLQGKLLAGGTFGGLVEIYLGTQLAALSAGAIFAVLALMVPFGALLSFSMLVMALGIAIWPWNRVQTQATKRAREVTAELPDFLELLVLPISAGMGIKTSISTIADEFDGPVGVEMRLLVEMLQSQAVAERDAFEVTGERLGTPAARAAMSTLLNGEIGGSKVVADLQRQAAGLRALNHQHRRETNKKLPVKLVGIFALHLLPLLLIVILAPVLLSLGKL
jgi:tight adherence protein C